MRDLSLDLYKVGVNLIFEVMNLVLSMKSMQVKQRGVYTFSDLTGWRRTAVTRDFYTKVSVFGVSKYVR